MCRSSRVKSRGTPEAVPECGGVGGEDPVAAVQGQFQAAAQGDPVDERERGDRFGREPAEYPVPKCRELRSGESSALTSCARSAPAAKLPGLPVTAIASGAAAIAVVIAASRPARPSGPNVFGRRRSRPLSRVIRATVTERAEPGESARTSRVEAWVTTSPSAGTAVTRGSVIVMI